MRLAVLCKYRIAYAVFRVLHLYLRVLALCLCLCMLDRASPSRSRYKSFPFINFHLVSFSKLPYFHYYDYVAHTCVLSNSDDSSGSRVYMLIDFYALHCTLCIANVWKYIRFLHCTFYCMSLPCNKSMCTWLHCGCGVA